LGRLVLVVRFGGVLVVGEVGLVLGFVAVVVFVLDVSRATTGLFLVQVVVGGQDLVVLVRGDLVVRGRPAAAPQAPGRAPRRLARPASGLAGFAGRRVHRVAEGLRTVVQRAGQRVDPAGNRRHGGRLAGVEQVIAHGVDDLGELRSHLAEHLCV